MSDKSAKHRFQTLRIKAIALAFLLFAGGAYLIMGQPFSRTARTTRSGPSEASVEQVHQFCGACHNYPPPESFPRFAWPEEVARGYRFFRASTLTLQPPPQEGVVAYYENRAALDYPKPEKVPYAGPVPVRFEPCPYRTSKQPGVAGVSNVNLVHLRDPKKLDVLVCDMYHGQVLLVQPYEPEPHLELLARVAHPAHAEVVDLDGDGILDILVADLGSFLPTNDKKGSVVWLRGNKDGTFTPVTLLQGVGRVADVQAADFRGTGQLDLVVAVFGWQTTGEILLLENRTTDWKHPHFVPHVLDDRHGAIHVPVADLNGDGRPDFVALISQEHETIVAFLNDGGGRFHQETIYRATHPAWGHTGIQLVDLDGDGDLDVLVTNGDVLDEPYLLKPFHGIQWLENRGTYPFEPHPLAKMYGVHRAVAADITGHGRKDILAVSFLLPENFPQREELDLDSILLLEQTAPGRFVQRSLETVTCDHATCAVGDVFATGRQDLVIGNFHKAPAHADPVVIWKNLGPR